MQQLSFEEKGFDAVITLDADLPDRNIFGQLSEATLLAADGSANHLLKLGIIPKYIVGDMDSFLDNDYNNISDNCTLIRDSDQETNDFEKTLIFASSLGFKNILIVGFHGGALEHSLNNWSVFARFSRKLNLCIFDKGRYGISINQSTEIKIRKQEIVSLIPQTEAKISTQNLKWSLSEEILKIGGREGARNISLADDIKIEIFYGELIMFIDSRLPYCPTFKNK